VRHQVRTRELLRPVRARRPAGRLTWRSHSSLGAKAGARLRKVRFITSLITTGILAPALPVLSLSSPGTKLSDILTHWQTYIRMFATLLCGSLVTALTPHAVCGTRSNQQPPGLFRFAFQFLNLLRRHARRSGELRPGNDLRFAVEDLALTPHHPITLFDQHGINGATRGGRWCLCHHCRLGIPRRTRARHCERPTDDQHKTLVWPHPFVVQNFAVKAMNSWRPNTS
jgi:hypothetical protein